MNKVKHFTKGFSSRYMYHFWLRQLPQKSKCLCVCLSVRHTCYNCTGLLRDLQKNLQRTSKGLWTLRSKKFTSRSPQVFETCYNHDLQRFFSSRNFHQEQQQVSSGQQSCGLNLHDSLSLQAASQCKIKNRLLHLILKSFSSSLQRLTALILDFYFFSPKISR